MDWNGRIETRRNRNDLIVRTAHNYRRYINYIIIILNRDRILLLFSSNTLSDYTHWIRVKCIRQLRCARSSRYTTHTHKIDRWYYNIMTMVGILSECVTENGKWVGDRECVHTDVEQINYNFILWYLV